MLDTVCIVGLVDLTDEKNAIVKRVEVGVCVFKVLILKRLYMLEAHCIALFIPRSGRCAEFGN